MHILADLSVSMLLQVVVLLNGKPVMDYTFSSGVFKTTCAPAGQTLPHCAS